MPTLLGGVEGCLSDHVGKGSVGQGDALHFGNRLFREVCQDVAGRGFDRQGATQLLQNDSRFVPANSVRDVVRQIGGDVFCIA